MRDGKYVCKLSSTPEKTTPKTIVKIKACHFKNLGYKDTTIKNPNGKYPITLLKTSNIGIYLGVGANSQDQICKWLLIRKLSGVRLAYATKKRYKMSISLAK
jgi:hypothetical protein